MNPAASPGRTWLIFVAQRWLFVLAPALAAVFFRGGGSHTRVSSMVGENSPCEHAYAGNQDNSRGKLGVKRHGDWWLGRILDSVSLKDEK